MPDHRLKPFSPLGHDVPRTDKAGPVTIAEVTSTALASLATRAGRSRDVSTVAKKLGLKLPGPGKAAAGTPFASFWLGPDQWMVEAPYETHEDLAAHLRTSFADAASITEQTDAWVRFDLTSPDLAPLFERLCAVDTRGMQPGDATRTLIEHLGTYVIKREDRMTILGPRSSAASLHHALITAARSAY